MLHVLQAETTRRREVEQQLKLTKMQLVGVLLQQKLPHCDWMFTSFYTLP